VGSMVLGTLVLGSFHQRYQSFVVRIMVGACLGLAPLLVQADDLSAQVSAGREKARPCTTCHGLDGQRHGGEMPTIGGRDYFDLLYQLGRFKRADRFQPAMTVLLQTFDESDMSDVAAYFASMDRARLAPPGPYQQP